MPLLPAAKYRARPVAAALGVTGTGKEQIAVTFDLVDPAGEKITWYGFFTEGALDRTLQSLRHCGWKGNDLSVFVQGEPLPEGFDQEVELDVQHEEYPKDSGQWHARVAWVNGGGGMALKTALTKDQALSFAERMKRQIDTLDKASGRATAGSAPKAAARPAQQSAARPAAAATSRPAATRPPVEQPQPSEEELARLINEQSASSDADVPY